jgi:hypothetical protein
MMEAPMADETEVVLLSDQNGEYYMVSRSVIEQGRLEGELKEAVVNALESEVSGFAFGAAEFQPAGSALMDVHGIFHYQMPQGINIAKVLQPGQ